MSVSRSGGTSRRWNPNRPRTLDALHADNDAVLYDRRSDPTEQHNLALDADQADLVASCSARLEALIDAELGPDTRAWVTERPPLLGLPKWRGDALRVAG